MCAWTPEQLPVYITEYYSMLGNITVTIMASNDTYSLKETKNILKVHNDNGFSLGNKQLNSYRHVPNLCCLFITLSTSNKNTTTKVS